MALRLLKDGTESKKGLANSSECHLQTELQNGMINPSVLVVADLMSVLEKEKIQLYRDFSEHLWKERAMESLGFLISLSGM